MEASLDLLVGVYLANGEDSCIRLGLVQVESETITLSQFRTLIKQQLHLQLPAYTFLSKHRWPVREDLEPVVNLGYAQDSDGNIRIEHKFDKPCIGIEALNGVPLGFVFISLDSSLQELRGAISEQLDQLPPPYDVPSHYGFRDAHNWPIRPHQELYLLVLDIVHSGRVILRPIAINSLPVVMGGDSIQSSVSSCNIRRSQDTRSKLLPQLTFGSVKDSVKQSSLDGNPASQHVILLSYVRVEAAEHALKLKDALVDLGYSVFLDVHEIKFGVDWQDSLNFAVSDCQAFVALVTPRYGKTQWTNREVKLADVLDKLMLPVSFLDHWPPRCLAIQFATTQYIPWKDGEETIDNISQWNADQITNVAREIARRIEDNQVAQGDESANHPVLLKKVTTLRSCPVQLPDGYAQCSQSRDGKSLILIAVHPQQTAYARELHDWLVADGYEVWCSLDLVSQDEYDSDTLFSQESCRNPSDTLDMACLSQLSPLSDVTKPGILCARQRRFQCMADEACAVVCVLSKAFARSRTSQQQVFYCESRKRMINICCEEFCLPLWLSMLIGTGHWLDSRQDNHKTVVLQRIKETVDPKIKLCKKLKEEERINLAVNNLSNQLSADVFVYIAGTNKFCHNTSQDICKEIGHQLASLNRISMATGTLGGAGQVISEAYTKERHQQNKQSTVWHILPVCDQDNKKPISEEKKKCTLYSGNNIWEREIIVAKVFNICILVEGGPNAAHEAEQFVWNDGIVVPVSCTGGAAAGKYNVPSEIDKLPSGVCKTDWDVLFDKSSTPQAIGISVRGIVAALCDRLIEEHSSVATSNGHSPRISNKPSMPFTQLRSSPRRHKSSRKKSPSDHASRQIKRQRDDMQRSDTIMFNGVDYTKSLDV